MANSFLRLCLFILAQWEGMFIKLKQNKDSSRWADIVQFVTSFDFNQQPKTCFVFNVKSSEIRSCVVCQFKLKNFFYLKSLVCLTVVLVPVNKMDEVIPAFKNMTYAGLKWTKKNRIKKKSPTKASIPALKYKNKLSSAFQVDKAEWTKW